MTKRARLSKALRGVLPRRRPRGITTALVAWQPGDPARAAIARPAIWQPLVACLALGAVAGLLLLAASSLALFVLAVALVAAILTQIFGVRLDPWIPR